MTIDQYQRAAIVDFAYVEASLTGSLPCMKGVVYVLRNRVRSGWYDGSWIAAINHHPDVAGNPEMITRPKVDLSNRLFQMMLQAVDDIFYGGSEDETEAVTGDCLYYNFIDRPVRQWFLENIIRDTENHPRRAHIGTIAFYE